MAPRLRRRPPTSPFPGLRSSQGRHSRPARPGRGTARARLGARRRLVLGAAPARLRLGPDGTARPRGAQVRGASQLRIGMTDIQELLGDEADSLLNHVSKGIAREDLHPPGSRHRRSGVQGQRPLTAEVRSLAALFDHGRLAGSGYVSILPVDQGIEHSAAASFAPNPACFDPEAIVELAIEGGCNAVAHHLRRARAVLTSLRPPHPVHRQDQPQRAADLSQRVRPDDHVPGSVEQALRPGRRRRWAPPSTSARPNRTARSSRVSEAFARRPTSWACSPCSWCYLRNEGFKVDGVDYHAAADPDRPGQPPRRHHRGLRHHQAEAAREQRPGWGSTRWPTTARPRSWCYTGELTTDHPIDPDPVAGGELLHGPRSA